MIRTGKILLSLLLLLGPQTHAADNNANDPALRVGTSASYPPLTFHRDGKPAGLEIDLAEAVGQQLKRGTRIVELPFAQLITALKDGRIDVIMSGMSVTDERSRQILFTEPYMQTGQMGLIRADELVEWSQPRRLLDKGRKIGVRAGTTGEQFVQTELPDADVVRFDSIDAASDALVAKEIDIFIHDAPTIWRLTANAATQRAGLMGLYRPLTEEYLAWAVRRQDRALADALNAALAVLEKDGTLNRLKGKWIPVQVKVGSPSQP
jgi:ABC-type amino acid transport substrate-binding protein